MRMREIAIIYISIVTLALNPSIARSQDAKVETHENEAHETLAHGYHPNHIGTFLGASTFLDRDESAFTMGIEYARRFSQKWAVAGYVESASSNIERDVIVVAGAVFYPAEGLALVLGPGVELAWEDVTEEETGEERKWLFLLRMGVGYGFRLGPQAAIGPVAFADWTEDRWTMVYGLGWVVGF